MDRVYWIDLCLTPRRPNATACFCDHWNPARKVELGSLIALPPRKRLELNSAGGRHASLISQLQAGDVERWFPDNFVWTERRLEASINLASDTIVSLMLRLNRELKNPVVGSMKLCEAITAQLAIELARYFVAACSPDTKGGLASWRMRLIEDRIGDTRLQFPTAKELAAICQLSTRQLSRAFRANQGCSIGDYLARARIEAAKRKLYGKDALAEIARSLGFASHSSFTTAFRRATGTTPALFRKRILVGRQSNMTA